MDGIYDSMLEFDPDTHLKLSTMKIDWKNDKMNLFKKYPRSQKNEDEDELMDSDDLGSFFTFFEAPDDDMGVRFLQLVSNQFMTDSPSRSVHISREISSLTQFCSSRVKSMCVVHNLVVSR